MKSSFVRALRDTVKTLAAVRCGPTPRQFSYMTVRQFSPGISTSCANGGASLLGKVNADVVCFGYSDSIDCDQLAPGNYCALCRLDLFTKDNGIGIQLFSKGVVIFGRFVDSTGQSAQKGGDCTAGLLTDGTGKSAPLMDVFVQRIPGGDGPQYTLSAFELRKLSGVVRINSSLVDLSRAKYFIPVPALTLDISRDWNETGSRQWITSLVPDEVYPAQDGCSLLDEAVQHQLLSLQANLSPNRSAATRTRERGTSLVRPPGRRDNCFAFNDREVCQ